MLKVYFKTAFTAPDLAVCRADKLAGGRAGAGGGGSRVYDATELTSPRENGWGKQPKSSLPKSKSQNCRTAEEDERVGPIGQVLHGGICDLEQPG